MKSTQHAVVPLLAVWTMLSATACSSSGSTITSEDASADGSSGSSSGSTSSSGSGGGSGSSGSGSSSGSSGSTGSSGSSGGSGAGDAGGDAGTCATNADCGGDRLCGFVQSAGCSAVGTCFPAPGTLCNAILLACACDGTSINVACNGLPGGYTPKPFAHSGTCGLDAGADDAGPADAGDWMDGAACVADGGGPCGAGLSCCPTAGYFGAPTACTPTCTGSGCAGSCRALP